MAALSGLTQPALRAVNLTRGTTLCAHLESADGLTGPARGLLGRDGLDSQCGMLFVRRRFEPFMWLHMMFMRFPIDVVFLDRESRVVRINRSLKPWRCSSLVIRARMALEMPVGSVSVARTEIGDLITLEQSTES